MVEYRAMGVWLWRSACSLQLDGSLASSFNGFRCGELGGFQFTGIRSVSYFGRRVVALKRRPASVADQDSAPDSGSR
jgi:hypothetical protein